MQAMKHALPLELAATPVVPGSYAGDTFKPHIFVTGPHAGLPHQPTLAYLTRLVPDTPVKAVRRALTAAGIKSFAFEADAEPTWAQIQAELDRGAVVVHSPEYDEGNVTVFPGDLMDEAEMALRGAAVNPAQVGFGAGWPTTCNFCGGHSGYEPTAWEAARASFGQCETCHIEAEEVQS
jgi:hypothetical protein